MSKSRAIFGITNKERKKILADRKRKENFKKSVRLYRIDKAVKELKKFYNIESEKYIKDESYFIEFNYKDFHFVVKIDYATDENDLFIKNICIDILHDNKVIKSLVYSDIECLFNLLAYISIYDVPESYFKNEKINV